MSSNQTSCQVFYVGQNFPEKIGRSLYISLITGYAYTISIIVYGSMLIRLCRRQKHIVPTIGDLMSSRKHRYQIVLGYAIMVQTVFDIIFLPDQVPLAMPLSFINWGGFRMGWIIRKICAINFYCGVYLPLFVGIRQATIFSRILVFFQSLFFFCLTITGVVICSNDANSSEFLVLIFGNLPQLCSCILLCLSMIFEISKQMRLIKKVQSSSKFSENLKTDLLTFMFNVDEPQSLFDEPHHEVRVKYLLSKKSTKPEIEAKNFNSKFSFVLARGKQFISQTIQIEPGFIYSTRVLSSSLLAFLIIYQFLVTICLTKAIEIENNLSKSEDNFENVIVLVYQIFSGDANATIVDLYDLPNFDYESVNSLIETIIFATWVSFVVSLGISALASFWNVIIQILIYKDHYKKLLQGIHVELNIQQLTAVNAVNSTLKYGSYLIAYQIWAFGFSIIFQWILCLILVYLVYLPAKLGYNWVEIMFYELTPILIYTTIIYFLQLGLSKYVFLKSGKDLKDISDVADVDHQVKIPTKNQLIDMKITNQKAYEFWTYVFWFSNLFIGLGSLLLRTAYAVLVSLFFLGRLDQPAVQRNWETLDAGYNCYLGHLAVEIANSHPGMVVFCKILLRRGQIKNNKNEDKENPRNLIARNRWFLAKTLIFNPKLKFYRKSTSKLKKSMKGEINNICQL